MRKPSLYVSYYCEVASNRSTEYICPAGSYCPEGSPAPTPCPAGSYGNTQGMWNASSCAECDPGKYCNDTGTSCCFKDSSSKHIFSKLTFNNSFGFSCMI